MCSQPSGDKWARSPDAGWCPWLCRAKQERAERKKVLALAQARKVDVILVTELTRWGRSARFAARSLTCFKVRFVSSPLIGLLSGARPCRQSDLFEHRSRREENRLLPQMDHHGADDCVATVGTNRLVESDPGHG